MSPPLSLLEDVLDDVSRLEEFVLVDVLREEVEEDELVDFPAFPAWRLISSARSSSSVE